MLRKRGENKFPVEILGLRFTFFPLYVVIYKTSAPLIVIDQLRTHVHVIRDAFDPEMLNYFMQVEKSAAITAMALFVQ